jgi:WD40 repeat protein
MRIFRRHTDRVRGVDDSPEGSLLATGSERACFDREMGRLDCVAFAPDGKTIAAAGGRDVVLWDLDL